MDTVPIFKLYVIVKLFDIYLLKVSNRNTKTRCEMCSKLTIKTPELRNGVLIIQFWTYFTPCSSVSIVNFEHAIDGW